MCDYYQNITTKLKENTCYAEGEIYSIIMLLSYSTLNCTVIMRNPSASLPLNYTKLQYILLSYVSLHRQRRWQTVALSDNPASILL